MISWLPIVRLSPGSRPVLDVEGLFSVSLDELHDARETTIPALYETRRPAEAGHQTSYCTRMSSAVMGPVASTTADRWAGWFRYASQSALVSKSATSAMSQVPSLNPRSRPNS